MAKKNKSKDENGLMVSYDKNRKTIVDGKSWVFTDSLNLAETMQTEHKEVLRKIRKVLKDYNIKDSEEAPPSSKLNEVQEYIHNNTDFTYSIRFYKNSQNKLQPYYKLSKDLLVIIMFAFRTERAKEFQKLYIAKFNSMEKELNWYKARYSGMVTRNYITDCIRDYYDINQSKINPYVFFTNLAYKTLYGYEAYKIRSKFGLPKGENIRPWLSDKDVKDVDRLEQEIGTLISYGLSLRRIESMINKKYANKSNNTLVLLQEKRK